MCFQEDVYTVLEDDGSITICVEFSGAHEISDPITVLVKTKDVSAEGMLAKSATSVVCTSYYREHLIYH